MPSHKSEIIAADQQSLDWVIGQLNEIGAVSEIERAWFAAKVQHYVVEGDRDYRHCNRLAAISELALHLIAILETIGQPRPEGRSS